MGDKRKIVHQTKNAKNFKVKNNRMLYHTDVLFSVLGTCATFSATAPLAQTEKGAARRGGAEVKKNVAVAVARKINGANSRHFRAIFERNFA